MCLGKEQNDTHTHTQSIKRAEAMPALWLVSIAHTQTQKKTKRPPTARAATVPFSLVSIIFLPRFSVRVLPVQQLVQVRLRHVVLAHDGFQGGQLGRLGAGGLVDVDLGKETRGGEGGRF